MEKQDIRWDLNDILNADDFDRNHKDLIQMIKKASANFYKLFPDMSEKEFKGFLRSYEKLLEKYSRLGNFAFLYGATHINDNKTFYYRAKASEISNLYNDYALNVTHFLMGENVKGVKRLDKKNAKRLFAIIPQLEYFFKHLQEAKKYTLSFQEERIIARKNTNLKSPLLQLYSMITNDFKYHFKPKGKKTRIIKTLGELTLNVRSSDPEMRKATYKALFKPYKENINKIFAIYQAISKDWDDNVILKKYSCPISIRNFSNDIDDKTVGTLMEVCSNNKQIFQKYFKLKAKVLKVKKLSRYDIYAPVGHHTKKYTLKEAKKKVLNVFDDFASGFCNGGKSIFDANHVDSNPRENKRSGAFCATVSTKVTPYVLLNFNGNADALMTMAHELGHGIHSLYSNKLSLLVSHSPLPLAETASTFSEMLMFDRLLSEIKDKKEKITLLFEKLGSSYATIMRQNYFVKFEIAAHNLLQKGATAEDLCKIYMENLKEQFGNSITIPSEFRYEWSYIPHIFNTPFYCYAYNFGELLSMALYSLYKEKGRSFIPKIEKILSSGSSVKPDELLKEVGIDINSKRFWQGSFKIIENWLDQVEELL